jgi:hypothetical protein
MADLNLEYEELIASINDYGLVNQHGDLRKKRVRVNVWKIRHAMLNLPDIAFLLDHKQSAEQSMRPLATNTRG